MSPSPFIGELAVISEKTLVNNLKTRYFKDKIYVSNNYIRPNWLHV